MSSPPLFTVVTACFNRGRHILPTINSVLSQTLADFELLIVCDGPDDPTLAAVPMDDTRVAIVALPSHSGSQAAPNNFGIALARGKFIAYLGHDDLWTPDHLASLSECFAKTGCDVAVAGCAFHGPPGTDLVFITGMFNDPAAARTHFFPPSSFAHRRRWPTGVPHWRPPEAIAAPVDADFLLRAVEDGAQFAATGKISTHKFAAGHRYLSYLAPASDEQSEFLTAMRRGAVDPAYEAGLIERAKAAGTFMSVVHPDFSVLCPGQLYHANRSNKGIDRVAPTPLTGTVDFPVSGEPRSLDWYPAETDPRSGAVYRWSGPSLRPKLLVPFTGGLAARITLHLYDDDPVKVIDSLQIIFNGVAVAHRVERQRPGWIDVAFIAPLQPQQSSIAELILQPSYCPAGAGARLMPLIRRAMLLRRLVPRPMIHLIRRMTLLRGPVARLEHLLADRRRPGVKLGGFRIAPAD